MKEKPWNRCDVCGRYIAYQSFYNGFALRELTRADTAFSSETYTTLCVNHTAHFDRGHLIPKGWPARG